MAFVASGTTTKSEIREIALRLFNVCQIALKRGAQIAAGSAAEDSAGFV
jgi:hypothetical protein